jgi:hypothetical protein
MPVSRPVKIVDETHEFINREIHRGVWHRHHLGEVPPVDATSFDETGARCETEVAANLKGKRQ